MEFETLQQAVEHYRGKYATRQNLSEKHIKNRRLFCDAILRYFHGKVFNFLTCEEYLDFLTEKNKPKSMVTKVKDLKAFVRFCYDYEYLDKDFSRRFTMPKVPKVLLKLVSEEEAIQAILAGTEPSLFDNKLAQHSKVHCRAALFFATFAGLRHSEIRKLKVGDLNLSQEMFTVHSKGGDIESANIPINQIEPMREWIQDKLPEDRLFEVTEDAMRRSYQRGLKKLGLLHQRVHDLRHLASITRLNRGSDLQKVSRFLRHKKMSTTDEIYSQYKVIDLKSTTDNTAEIQKTASAEKVLDGYAKAVKDLGALGDPRFEFTHENGELRIKVRKTTQ